MAKPAQFEGIISQKKKFEFSGDDCVNAKWLEPPGRNKQLHLIGKCVVLYPNTVNSKNFEFCPKCSQNHISIITVLFCMLQSKFGESDPPIWAPLA